MMRLIFARSISGAFPAFPMSMRVLGCLAVCASLMLTACGHDPAQVAAPSAPGDGYLWTESDGNPARIHVQALDGSALGMLPVDDAVQASLAVSGETACVLDLDRVLWRGRGIGGRADAHARISHDAYRVESLSRPFLLPVHADRHGQCLFPFGNSKLGWLSPQAQGVSTVPVGSDFVWTDMDYVGATDTAVLVGRDQFAVATDVTRGGPVATVKIRGKVHGLAVDDLTCCSRLSPDGKTLYSMAEAGDETNSGHTILAAIDVASGTFRRFYLPYFPGLPDCGQQQDTKQRADCEESTRFPLLHHPEVALATDVPQPLDLSPDGKTLYVEAATRRDDKFHLVAVDTDSGKVTPLPVDGNFSSFAVSASGRYLFVETWGEAPHSSKRIIKLYRLPAGTFVRDLPGEKLISAWK